ncbi:hypothetical protein HanXRQr2_Chr02g0068481 [Helianthus annuus]|uniref:Uncharacterized protein n=1 Tax=Helianthus annuus TaxID=4232 RepID=A0A9K3JQB3_HELAN|nr:hypothetical protein HanXRQr2_Chr02g0068481 [Helianthus annuus]KAJ0951965.1 hypothetical protein HanPSC8_Chr02g0066581 [Helianthus annuus]
MGSNLLVLNIPMVLKTMSPSGGPRSKHEMRGTILTVYRILYKPMPSPHFNSHFGSINSKLKLILHT